MKLTTDDRAALQGAMNVLMEILQHTPPEVPNTVHVWPENDTALRPYQWRERDGDTWTWLTTTSEWECYDEAGIYAESAGHPFDGPWDRVTDG